MCHALQQLNDELHNFIVPVITVNMLHATHSYIPISCFEKYKTVVEVALPLCGNKTKTHHRDLQHFYFRPFWDFHDPAFSQQYTGCKCRQHDTGFLLYTAFR